MDMLCYVMLCMQQNAFVILTDIWRNFDRTALLKCCSSFSDARCQWIQ